MCDVCVCVRANAGKLGEIERLVDVCVRDNLLGFMRINCRVVHADHDGGASSLRLSWLHVDPDTGQFLQHHIRYIWILRGLPVQT